MAHCRAAHERRSPRCAGTRSRLVPVCQSAPTVHVLFRYGLPISPNAGQNSDSLGGDCNKSRIYQTNDHVGRGVGWKKNERDAQATSNAVHEHERAHHINLECVAAQLCGWMVALQILRCKYAPISHNVGCTKELMKERLLSANPDVICLQETSEKSFASDFSFLHKAGYDCAILSKGRMRPATFWRGLLELVCADGSRPEPIPPPSPTLSDDGGPTGVPSFIESSFTCKVTYEAWVKKTRDQAAKAAKAAGEAGETAADPEAIALARMTAVANDAVRGGAVVLNGDRILTTMLRHVSIDSADPSPPPPPIFVLNCHLSAGSEARRRLRQVSDALDAVRKLLAKVSPAGAAAAKGGDKGGGGKGGGGKGGGDKGGGNKGDGKGGAKAKAAVQRRRRRLCGLPPSSSAATSTRRGSRGARATDARRGAANLSRVRRSDGGVAGLYWRRVSRRGDE